MVCYITDGSKITNAVVYEATYFDLIMTELKRLINSFEIFIQYANAFCVRRYLAFFHDLIDFGSERFARDHATSTRCVRTFF